MEINQKTRLNIQATQSAECTGTLPLSTPQSILQKLAREQKNQEQGLITDFSSMFKSKGGPTRRPAKPKNSQTKTPNWLLQIPAKLDITKDDIQKRRVMDNRKWMSITKTSESNMKMIAAVCSSWNYLCSDKGIGSDKYLSMAKCMQLIKDHVELQQLKESKQFGRVWAITKMISILNTHTDKNLSVQICTKLADPNKLQPSAKQQKQCLLSGISSNKYAYIYLAYQDIFCPIGFDITPLKPLQAYVRLENIEVEHQQLWIINSTLGRNQPSFCIKRWTDVQKDLQTVWPDYMDIKQHKLGVRPRPDATQQNRQQSRGTSNCILRIQLKDK